MTFTGVDVTLSHLIQIEKAGPRGMSQGIKVSAESIRDLAKYYCPKDTHALEKSILISQDNPTEGVPGLAREAVTIVCGDSTAYYAIYVHENLQAYHAAPTQAKFLERAVRESAPLILDNCHKFITADYNRTIGGVKVGNIVPPNPAAFGL
jgi:hypothetical protein